MVHFQSVGLLLLFMQLSNNLAEKQIDEGFPTLPPTASSTDNSNNMNKTPTGSTESKNDLPVKNTSSTKSPCKCVTENGTRSLKCARKPNVTHDDGGADIYPPPIIANYDTCPGRVSTSCETSLDLKVRWDLKCRKQCHLFKDCCKNPEKSPEKPIQNGTCVQTFRSKDVLMVDYCPPTYEDASIKKYCENYLGDFLHDLWLMTPVTDSKTNTTYKNIFCAACNGKLWDELKFWELLLVCFKKESGKKLALQWNTEQDGSLFTRLHPRTKGFWKYMPKNQQEDGSLCFFHPRVGDEIEVLPCPRKQLLDKSIDKIDDCLFSYKQPRVVNHTTRNLPPPYLPQAEIILNPGNNMELIPRFSKCDDKGPLQKNGLYDHVCTQSDGKARCQLKLADCPEFNHYSLNSTSFDDARFVNYEKYVVDSLSFFVCGPKVFHSTWVEVILKILLYLVRAAVIGLLLQLLIFLWLPAKSTLDKNLGSLSFTLLIQNVCLLFARQKASVSCRIIASVWHYSMLSSFTWVLILSYDCWLTLRQLFQIYQLVGEYDLIQFLIYFAGSQIIPLLVTSAALTFGTSQADWYCQQELVLSRYECLLAEVPEFMKFFIIPAAIMLTLNIYFLVHMGCLVFPRQLYLKEVRQKFKERSGFAMMISPTWMLGSLLLISHYKLPKCDMLIFMVHILQASFFLIYTFKQWLGRIMQKYEDIERNIIGDPVYCPMTTSGLSTEDHRLLSVLERRQLEPRENENLYL